MIYKCFEKKSAGRGSNTHANKSDFNYERPLGLTINQLAKELHKPSIRKFKKRIVYSRFKDNIWGADLADMQLISKFNKGLDFYCALLIFLVNMLGLFL